MKISYKYLFLAVILLSIAFAAQNTMAEAYGYDQAKKSEVVNLAAVDLVYAAESPSQNLKDLKNTDINPANHRGGVFSGVDKFFEKIINKIISVFSS